MSSYAMINPADTMTITSIDDSEAAHSHSSVSSAVPIVDLEPNLTKTEASSSSSPVSTPPEALESGPSTSPSGSGLSSNEPSAAGTSKDEDAAAAQKDGAGDEKKDESMFECNICLDTAKDAVVSMCGHLFCWPCLHQWLETRPRRQLCPVCKAAVSKDKVIPLYGRGSTNQQDPRTKVPPRPAGQRSEPEAGGFQGFGLMDGGFHMSFGIGAFPLGYLSSTLNFDGRRGNRGEWEWTIGSEMGIFKLGFCFSS